MLNTETIPFDVILKNTKLISDFSLFEILTLFTIIIVLVLSIFYFIPLIQIKIKINTLDKWAKNRKRLLKKIITQKQIEEEIEKEIEKLDLKD